MSAAQALQRTAARFMDAERPYRLTSFLVDGGELEMSVFCGNELVAHRVWDLDSFDMRFDAIFEWLRATIDAHKRGSAVAVVGPWKKWGRRRSA